MTERIILGIIAFIAVISVCFRHFNNVFYKHLFELEEVFDSELDFVHLSKNILAKVIQVAGASSGLLYWYDENQREYKLKTLQGIPAEKISGLTKFLRQPGSVFDQLGTQTKSFMINTYDNKKYVNNPVIENLILLDDFRHVIAFPLKINQKQYGVIILLNEKKGFRNRGVKLINSFAPRSAVHLEKTCLYQITKETAIENARLYLNLSRLYHQATSDELTGLYNRNFMMQRLKEEVKKAWRFKQPLSIIFTDIDYFKTINDQYGHQVGDQVLTEFGSLLKNSVREYDIACRFGGEEFIVLLPHTRVDNARELAERLRQKIENFKFSIPESNVKITSSFGVSAIPEITDTSMPSAEDIHEYIDNLIDSADKALYSAKQGGRNIVRYYPYKSLKKSKKPVYSVNNCRG